jgi:signal transduction histidine kinase
MSANKILKRSNIHFEFMIEEAVESIEIKSDLGTALFRIFQEIMTNIARHANASVVTLQAFLHENDLTITVKDDGHGMIAERRSDPNSWGIIGMKERIRYFGGNFTISGGSIGAGTTVTIQLPIEVDFIGLPRRSRIHYQQSPVAC